MSVATPTPPSPAPDWVFLVPGEYAGRCGIVDYAFRLAREAVLAGGRALLASFRPVSPEVLAQHRAALPLDAAARLLHVALPLEAELRWATFTALLREWPSARVSLQIYPLMFRQGRWLAFQFRALARALGRRRPLVTAHELSSWLVPGPGRAGPRAFRSAEIALGLHLLRPRAVFCSNMAHARELRRFGLRPRIVPVFSNIPPAPDAGSPPPFADLLARAGSPRDLPADLWTGLFFGRILDDGAAPTLALAFQAEARARGRTPLIVSVGEVGHEERGWRRLASSLAPGEALRLGVLPGDEVSRLLLRADLGLSPTPLELWSKSSGCAAMLAHGLRVAFLDERDTREGPLPARYALRSAGRLRFAEAPAARRAPEPTPAAAWAALTTAASPRL